MDDTQRIIAGWAAHHGNTDRGQDVIEPEASARAVRKLKKASDVAVFIGHDTGSLPVGVPVKIEPQDKGLYTETRIFEGPVGDNLLAVAKGLRAHGQTLGMSIGYRPTDFRMEMVNGRVIRRLLDYELVEYSYAASQMVMNPMALVVGVKTLGGSMFRIMQRADGRHEILDEKTGQIVSDHATAAEAMTKLSALYGVKTGGGDEGAVAHTWDELYVHNLPDSAFLTVQAGGQVDSEGKTVPRSYRALPIRNADGNLDPERLRLAVDGVRAVAWLDDQAKTRLHAHARTLLDSATLNKTVDTTREASGAAPLDLKHVGYALFDIADELVGEHKAMRLLGEDTRDGMRIRSEMRQRIGELADQLVKAVTRAEQIDSGADGTAKADWYRRQLELLEVS